MFSYTVEYHECSHEKCYIVVVNGSPLSYDTTAVGLSVFLSVHCIAASADLFGKCCIIISLRGPKGPNREKKEKSITKRT